MTDEDVVRRFQSIVGGEVYGPYHRGEPRKPIFYWNGCRWAEIIVIAERFIPFLGSRRRAAMEALLANPPRTTYECRRGHGREHSVMRKGRLVCRLCERIATERKKKGKRRLTDIPCECGCGEYVYTQRDTGLPNRFVNGHQRKHNSRRRFA